MPRDPLGDRVRLFGIRHHGPGSARSLLAALDDWRPDLLIVEGPPEAEVVVPYLLGDDVVPPIAMLLYDSSAPRRASYYPLAEFSPEYQTFRYAHRAGVPVRMMDLPASAYLGMRFRREFRNDVMDQAAEASGFDDIEDWWEHLVEHRRDPTDLFAGVEELMTALREESAYEELNDAPAEEPDEDQRPWVSQSQYEAMREAHMRRTLRKALTESHERIAVVCGAMHLPALRVWPTTKDDDALLKGLPKVKTGGTVVPWTYERLTFASGYGAGARSPAFYDLLWHTDPEEVPSRWLMGVARLMRAKDLDASPAAVIEAVRLADALAALRSRPRPGLRELCEAAEAVLIRDEAIWPLIGRKLIVGDRMGQVPASIPLIPIQADLVATAKRLRLKMEDAFKDLALDLRKDNDLERSHLLHRLDLLGIDWGVSQHVEGKKGTFHEHWLLKWEPELTIRLIEASVYGSTIADAATAFAREEAAKTTSLAEIAGLIERVLTSDLPDAVAPVVEKLQALSATGADLAELAAALPPLANLMRYGTVRRTDVDQVSPVFDAIFTRLCIGLPNACASLDDEAARVMAKRLGKVGAMVHLLNEPSKTEEWLGALRSVAGLVGSHGVVIGKAERLRFDLGDISGEDLGVRLGQEASRGVTALDTAAFVEGLLDGPGAILIHQESLFHAVDNWITGMDTEVFDEIVPLIRRSFTLFTKAERRQLGERVAGGTRFAVVNDQFDEEYAQRVLPYIRRILGVSNE